MNADLLYEIGTEEIPAGYLAPAARGLESEVRAFLTGAALPFRSLSVDYTPRRLALSITGLPESQEDRVEEVTGPPWKAAFAGDGTPTKAAEGFAKGRGLAVADLVKVETEKGPYVGATVTTPGRRTADLLAEALPAATAAIVFPKTMRWGPDRFRFARPIRWLVALLGGEVVPFSIEGVQTGRATFGHRLLGPGPFEMRSPADYADSLAKGRVVPNAALREERIAALLADAARDAGGTLVPDAALVEEVACLVETPHALTGSFDDEFLRLPEIVIRTAMRSHQRYFVVAGPDGKLLPRFLCVLNGEPGDPAQVRDGNERVLRARLDDARFYWTEDRRTTLEEKVPRLADIVWLRGFGSLGDKTDRVRKLAVSIASAHFPDAEQTTDRAALLSKTDLTTEMIRDGKEFTALQGTIGKEYARACGEPDEVAAAIEEQYFPRHAGDGLPASPAGAAIALADRIDTLVGVWGAGLKPTGSKDPHGLRRGAIGVIRILLDRNLAERVGSLIRAAADLYGGLLADPDTVVAEASAFVRDRLAGHLAEEGFDADVAAAVVASSGGNPVDARARTEALTAMRRTSRDDFEALAAGFKRARNILKKESAEGAPERDLLTEDAETALFDAFAAVDAEVGRAEEECRYAEALAGLASLRGPIDHFFDSVMVLTDDDAVRRNRLRLLGRIADRFAGLADLSRISPPERGAA